MLEILVVGNVGSVKFFDGKTPVLNINIASSRKVGDREFTDWTSAKVWGERAGKLADHVKKGMRLLLRGRPEAKGYSREDGSVAGELILHVNELEFLSPKPKPGDEVGEEHAPVGEGELPLRTYNTPAAAVEAGAEAKTRRQRRN